MDTIKERFPHLPDRIAGLGELEKILPENAQFENFEVEHDFSDIGHKKNAA